MVARYEVDELFRQQPVLLIGVLGGPSLGTTPTSQDQLQKWPTGRDCWWLTNSPILFKQFLGEKKLLNVGCPGCQLVIHTQQRFPACSSHGHQVQVNTQNQLQPFQEPACDITHKDRWFQVSALVVMCPLCAALSNWVPCLLDVNIAQLFKHKYNYQIQS